MRYLSHLNPNLRAHEDRPGTIVGALPSHAGRGDWHDVPVLRGRIGDLSLFRDGGRWVVDKRRPQPN